MIRGCEGEEWQCNKGEEEEEGGRIMIIQVRSNEVRSQGHDASFNVNEERCLNSRPVGGPSVEMLKFAYYEDK